MILLVFCLFRIGLASFSCVEVMWVIDMLNINFPPIIGFVRRVSLLFVIVSSLFILAIG
jgi:hypothetical protein